MISFRLVNRMMETDDFRTVDFLPLRNLLLSWEVAMTTM
jgi:hypothetical protein